jgi:hypothetical protein
MNLRSDVNGKQKNANKWQEIYGRAYDNYQSRTTHKEQIS